MTPPPLARLRRALDGGDLGPTLRLGAAVVLLFGAGVWLTRRFAAPLGQVLAEHAVLGVVVFFVTSVVAVLLPVLSNLPLLPLAVLAWGPVATALILLTGWITGAALSFALARHARERVLRALPAVTRHARIDRLIHPGHRFASLVLLRATFPVDVLSYALGLFSRDTTAAQNAAATAVGAAPFAVVFAWFPTLPPTAQALLFGGSLAVFAGYVAWVWRRPDGAGAGA